MDVVYEKRLKALTMIRHYSIKREDGTTAATRLFDTESFQIYFHGYWMK